MDPPGGIPGPRCPEDAWPAADMPTSGQKRPRQAPQPWGHWRGGDSAISGAPWLRPRCCGQAPGGGLPRALATAGEARAAQSQESWPRARPRTGHPTRCCPSSASEPVQLPSQSCPGSPEVARGQGQGKKPWVGPPPGGRVTVDVPKGHPGTPPAVARTASLHCRPARVSETRILQRALTDFSGLGGLPHPPAPARPHLGLCWRCCSRRSWRGRPHCLSLLELPCARRVMPAPKWRAGKKRPLSRSDVLLRLRRVHAASPGGKAGPGGSEHVRCGPTWTKWAGHVL